jgi:broad specificity phosphatase PhoE
MSRLLLVRHAQASFFADSYDQLSALGEHQARALGEHWLRLGIAFDEVIVGPRKRQIQTEQLVRSVYNANQKPWPRAQIRPEFDEHCVDQLLEEPLNDLYDLLRRHPALEPLVTDYRNATVPDHLQRSFQRLFEAACHLWCAAEQGTDSVESWNSFYSRVETGLRNILERPGRNRTVGVFTSVGNITAALCFVVGCTPDRFNDISHLTRPSTWTFR